MNNLQIISEKAPYYIRAALSKVDANTFDKLVEFYSHRQTLESNYRTYADELISTTLRDSSSNETRKQLTTFLIDIGFKKSNVSKMLRSQEFILEHEKKKSHATDWLKSLPLSSVYVLSAADDKAFAKIWANDSQFGEISLPQRKLEELVDKYNKKQPILTQTRAIAEDSSKKFPQETIETTAEHIPESYDDGIHSTGHEQRQAEQICNGVELPEGLTTRRPLESHLELKLRNRLEACIKDLSGKETTPLLDILIDTLVSMKVQA